MPFTKNIHIFTLIVGLAMILISIFIAKTKPIWFAILFILGFMILMFGGFMLIALRTEKKVQKDLNISNNKNN